MNSTRWRHDHRQSGFWAVRKSVVDFFQCALTGLIFTEICEHEEMTISKHLDGGWFPLLYSTIEERLHLSKNCVKTAVNKFLEVGFLERKPVGVPATFYYRFNIEAYEKNMDEFYENKGCSVQGNSTSSVQGNSNTFLKEKESKEKGVLFKRQNKTQASSKAEDAPSPIKPTLRLRKTATETKLAPSPKIPPHVVDIFMFWNSLSLLSPIPKHKIDVNTTTFVEGSNLIQKALKKHTVEQIQESINNYVRLITDENSKFNWLCQKKRPGLVCRLPDFFKFSNYVEELMLKNKDVDIPENWFTECLKPYDELISLHGKYEKDPNPVITKNLISRYMQKTNQEKFSITDHNCFIKASKKLLSFHQTNAKSILWASCIEERTRPELFARRLIDACFDEVKDQQSISPTWLCSNNMFAKRLPNYLRKIGLMRKEGLKQKEIVGYDPGYRLGELE